MDEDNVRKPFTQYSNMQTENKYSEMLPTSFWYSSDSFFLQKSHTAAVRYDNTCQALTRH